MSALSGRAAELAWLTGLLDDVEGGAARFAMIRGEPGIGKTALLAELARLARERRFLVLEGRAMEIERDLPFAVWVDALDEHLDSLDARAIERLAADGLADLAAVFPSLRALATAPARDLSPADRHRFHHAVRELLERMAARQPLLVVADDLQWADGGSVELAAHLIRRAPRAPVLVAAASRQPAGATVLDAPIRAALDDGTVGDRVLRPLARDEASPLLAAVPGGRRDELYKLAGGNPFYLEELARAGAGGVVPESVAVAIATELGALPAAAHDLVRGAAVAGDPFDVDLAAAASGQDEAELTAGLDQLVARGLVAPLDAGRRFRFRHPLVRSAVYDEMPHGTRLIAHRRAAAALEERGASAGERAAHVARAARPGDTDAVALLREAAVAAEWRTPATAASLYRSALALVPDDVGLERVELSVGLAHSLAAAGEARAAVEVLAPLIDQLTSAGAPPVELTVGCAIMEHQIGRYDEARQRLVRATADTEPGSVEQFRLHENLAVISHYMGDFEDMARQVHTATTSAVGQAEPGLRATALGLETWSATVAGALRRARAGHARALPAFAELPDAEIVNWLDGVGLLASGCMFLERYRDALEIAARGLAAVDAHGAPPGAPLVMLRLVPAAAHLFLGHLERSATLHDEAIDTARLTRDRQGLMWALSWRGRVAHAAGDTDAALSLGKESIAIADELGTVGLSAWIAGNFAAVLAGAGQHRLARDVLLSRCGGPELPLAGAVERPRLFATLADAALALDGPDAALPWVERAEEEARELALPVGACHAARVRAGLLAAHGNHAEAAEVALAPVAGAEEAGSLVDAAYMRVIAGRALGASGDRAGAIELLEGAEAALERYGAGRLAKIAARELRRLGRGRRQRSRAALDSGGVESLSDRELEVAELVRARRTNVQIAAELFLSRKTIDTHMTNIFRKLGASSRVEVAERLEQVAASR